MYPLEGLLIHIQDDSTDCWDALFTGTHTLGTWTELKKKTSACDKSVHIYQQHFVDLLMHMHCTGCVQLIWDHNFKYQTGVISDRCVIRCDAVKVSPWDKKRNT